MANTWLTLGMVARQALVTLYANSVMLPLVYKDYNNDLMGTQGGTVSVRVPATFTANEYSSSVGTVKQYATESNVDVSLDTVWDVTIPITDLEATVSLDDMTGRVLQPAMEAIAQAVDTQILTLRDDVTASVTCGAYDASTNPHPTFDEIDAGRTLDVAKVPQSNRIAVIDPYIAAQWMRDDLANRADARGDAGTALREAWVNRSFGFDNIKSTNITDQVGVGFHPTAFAFVSRPQVLPKGAASASVVSYKGLSVRVIWDYDAQYKTDVVSIDLLCGVKTMDANRAVLFNGLADSV